MSVGTRLVALLAIVPVAASAGCAAKYKQFGEPLTVSQTEEMDVAVVLADPQAYDGKTVRLVGLIDDVCAHKGCWIDLTDGKEKLKVKFTCPIDGRLVPVEAKGHKAVVAGKFELREIAEADRRHYAEDAGKSAEEIKKIVGPAKWPWIRCEGVMIEDVGQFN